MSPTVIYEHEEMPDTASMTYRSELVSYEPGVWEVLSYRLELDNGDELINNTGTIDNWPEAKYNYELHLDLYFGITLEESLAQQEAGVAQAKATMSELEERVELEGITLQVLADELAKIAEQIKDIERQVKDL
jgi:hypothetical protein